MNVFLGETTQKLAYSLSYIAIIEFSYHVIGIGSSFSSMNFTALALAQMKKTLAEIKKMVQIILSTPLKTAGKKVLTAINYLENQLVDEAIGEFRAAKEDAQTAYEYAKAQGTDLEVLRQVETAFQIIILAKFSMLSYNKESGTIEPFSVLDDNKQKAIAKELERDCYDFLEYHANVKVGLFSLNRDTKKLEIKSVKNNLLKCLYPYISEGNKYTSPNKELPMVFEIECNSKLIPDDEDNATLLNLGFRKYKGNNVRESAMLYKDSDGDVVAVQSLGRILFYERKKSKTTVKFGPMKPYALSSFLMRGIEFERTTDKNPVFYATRFEVCKNRNLPYSYQKLTTHFDPGSVPSFYLYKSTGNAWFCSTRVGEDDDYHSCVLRNIPRQKPEAITEWPPLTGWEYFHEDGDWKQCILQHHSFCEIILPDPSDDLECASECASNDEQHRATATINIEQRQATASNSEQRQATASNNDEIKGEEINSDEINNYEIYSEQINGDEINNYEIYSEQQRERPKHFTTSGPLAALDSKFEDDDVITFSDEINSEQRRATASNSNEINSEQINSDEINNYEIYSEQQRERPKHTSHTVENGRKIHRTRSNSAEIDLKHGRARSKQTSRKVENGRKIPRTRLSLTEIDLRHGRARSKHTSRKVENGQKICRPRSSSAKITLEHSQKMIVPH